IRGKVRFQGRPVTSGAVVVLNSDGTAVKGAIQPDGSYSVAGVVRGRVKIGVLSARPGADHKNNAEGWFPLPRVLGNPGTSGLVCDVTGSRVQHDLEIK